MKQLVIVLTLLFMASPLVAAGMPKIIHVAEPEASYGIVERSVDLWIAASGPWQLHATASSGLVFLDAEDRLVQKGTLYSGTGPMESSPSLEVHFEESAFTEEQASLNLQLTLEGAHGIFGLPLQNHYWILPLNNEELVVEREGSEKLTLQSGTWFLLEVGDSLFYGQEEVVMPRSESAVLTLQKSVASPQADDLWWTRSDLYLDTGDKAVVSLQLRGPQEASQLWLQPNEYVALADSWFLDGQVLNSSFGPDQMVCVDLPALPEGVYELSGTLQALLPPPSRPGLLTALWKQQQATLTISIDRSWFDHDYRQIIHLETPGDTPIIMPDGQVRTFRGQTTTSVNSESLDLLLPVANPKQPIWTGFPLSESVLWKVDAPEGDPQAFLVPIFLWDQGFSWRLVGGSEQWFFDTTAQRQWFRAQVGRLSIEGSKDHISLSSGAPRGLEEGNWHWWESVDARKGIWRNNSWLWRLAIPREDGKTPSLAVGYSAESWAFRLSPQELELRFVNEKWEWGTRLSDRALWLKAFQGRLRLELNPYGVKFGYTHGDELRLGIQVDDDQNIDLQLAYKPWELYIRGTETKHSEVGLRFKQAHSSGRWLSLTKGATQLKNELFLFELEQHLGYVLSPWCTLYVEAAATGSIPNKLQGRYGGGIVLTPLPQLVASVGWDSEQGAVWKAGVVVPFVGRKTQEK